MNDLRPEDNEPLDFEEEFLPVRRRNPVLQLFVMTVIAVGCGLCLWWLRFDLAYAFADDKPTDMGFADELDLAKAPTPGTYVVVKGTRHIRRLHFKSMTRDNYFFPFLGTSAVYALAPRAFDEKRMEEHGMRSDERYTGRLWRLGQMQEFPRIREWYARELRQQLDPNALVVEEQVTPGDKTWVVFAYGLVALAGLLALVRMVLTVRSLVRRS